MGYPQNRIIWKNAAGDLVDISMEMSRIAEDSIPSFELTQSAGGALYIGSPFPFSSRYFRFTTANALTTATMTVSLWNGKSFEAAVDVIDDTSVSGRAFGESGHRCIDGKRVSMELGSCRDVDAAMLVCHSIRRDTTVRQHFH